MLQYSAPVAPRSSGRGTKPWRLPSASQRDSGRLKSRCVCDDSNRARSASRVGYLQKSHFLSEAKGRAKKVGKASGAPII